MLDDVKQEQIVAKGEEIRASVPGQLKRLVKAISGLKNGGKDWTLSDAVKEALEDWINRPENKELREYHKLDEKFKD